MENVSQGNGRANGQALYVSTTRRNILAIIYGNPLFTAAEQLRANHNTHECEDAARLAVWLRNVRRVAADREVMADAAVLVNAPTDVQPAMAENTAVAAQPLTVAHLIRLPAAPPYTGSTSDLAADVSDRWLEEWNTRETGLSYADLARL